MTIDRRSWTGSLLTTCIIAGWLTCATTGTAAQVPISGPNGQQDAVMEALQSRMPAGNAGLEMMIAEGSIRRVSKDDISAWSARGGRLRMVAGPMMMAAGNFDPLQYVGQTTSAYLILKRVEVVPTGLAGADAVIFITPQGMPVPRISPVEHNTFYVLDGYQGIPPAGPPVQIDERARMISSVNERNRGLPTDIAPRPMRPSATSTDQGIDDRSDTSDKSLIVGVTLAMMVILATIMGAMIHWNRTTGRKTASDRPGRTDRKRTSSAIGTTMGRPIAKPLEKPTSACVAADASTDDQDGPADLEAFATTVEREDVALSSTLTARSIRKAMTLTAYDDDLDDELGQIIDHRIGRSMSTLMSAISDGSVTDAAYDAFRSLLDRSRTQIDDIVVEQSARTGRGLSDGRA